jgi:formylglycine-generating enzyme required for sulfatase activity
MDLAGTLANPVESITWIEASRWLDRLALAFPTEAQWEYAARGGTRTAWWTGDDRESLRGAANLADQAAARSGQDWREIADWPELDDGFAIHAPIGRLRANPFGLHDVAGNLWEWCDDVFGDYRDPVREGDGRQLKGYDLARPARGGGMSNKASDARSARRENYPPDMRALQIGLRPVRKIER